MADVAGFEPGETWTYEWTFTRAGVERFADLSGDRRAHQLGAGEDGTVMVQGLLTAIIPTRVGGDIDYPVPHEAVRVSPAAVYGPTRHL